MLAIMKRAWIDVVFLLAMVIVLFAGMRGFSRFFPIALGLALFYLLLMIARSFRRKSRPEHQEP